jgi:hypothetical protein
MTQIVNPRPGLKRDGIILQAFTIELLREKSALRPRISGSAVVFQGGDDLVSHAGIC